MNRNLAAILDKKKKQSSDSPKINWDDRRNKYLAAVQVLYNQIETFLADPIKLKKVTVQRRRKQLSEDYIGTYEVEDLLLVIGDEQVRFSPRGRNTAGAAGRVDVIGERNEATLIVQPGPRWSFVQSRQPNLRVVPFDESTFAEVLKVVMRD